MGWVGGERRGEERRGEERREEGRGVERSAWDGKERDVERKRLRDGWRRLSSDVYAENVYHRYLTEEEMECGEDVYGMSR